MVNAVEQKIMLKRRRGMLVDRLQARRRAEKQCGMIPYEKVSDAINELTNCSSDDMQALVDKWEEWEREKMPALGVKTEEMQWQDYSEQVHYTLEKLTLRAYRFQIETGEMCTKAAGFIKKIKDIEAGAKTPEEALEKLSKIRKSIASHYEKL